MVIEEGSAKPEVVYGSLESNDCVARAYSRK